MGKVSKGNQDDIDAIMAEIDLSGWAILSGDTQDLLESVTKDGSAQALLQLGVTDKDMFTQANEGAAVYAKDRAAEMVGMKWVDGELVENPNAAWAITESTRDSIKELVTKAFNEKITTEKLVGLIKEDYAFSSKRAKMIARTETHKADVYGNLNGWKTSGEVDRKEWATAQDDLVSDECVECQDAGVIGIDDLFPSGDVAPPAHPNCRCDLLPVLKDNEND